MNLVSVQQRIKAGRALRGSVPRKSHAGWKPPSDRPDPIKLLIDSDQGTHPEATSNSIRPHEEDAVYLLRGAAAIMACDLARTPTTKVRVQAGGDCHIMNFGAFATPERNLIFDINDFDETLPAPFEWDLKRLATSIQVAGRSAGSKSKDCEKATRSALRCYRERMGEYAQMAALEVWYQRIDFDPLIKHLPASCPRAWQKSHREGAQKKSAASHPPYGGEARQGSNQR